MSSSDHAHGGEIVFSSSEPISNHAGQLNARVKYTEDEKAFFREQDIPYTPDTEDEHTGSETSDTENVTSAISTASDGNESHSVESDRQVAVRQGEATTESEIPAGSIESSTVTAVNDKTKQKSQSLPADDIVPEHNSMPRVEFEDESTMLRLGIPSHASEETTQLHRAIQSESSSRDCSITAPHLETTSTTDSLTSVDPYTKSDPYWTKINPLIDAAPSDLETEEVRHLRAKQASRGRTMSYNAARAYFYHEQFKQIRKSEQSTHDEQLDRSLERMVDLICGMRKRGRSLVLDHEPRRPSLLSSYTHRMAITVNRRDIDMIYAQLRTMRILARDILQKLDFYKSRSAKLEAESNAAQQRFETYQKDMKSWAKDKEEQLQTCTDEKSNALIRINEMQAQLRDAHLHSSWTASGLGHNEKIQDGPSDKDAQHLEDQKRIIVQLQKKLVEQEEKQVVLLTKIEQLETALLQAKSGADESLRDRQQAQHARRRHKMEVSESKKEMAALREQIRQMQTSIRAHDEENRQHEQALVRIEELNKAAQLDQEENEILRTRIVDLEIEHSGGAGHRQIKEIFDHVAEKLGLERELRVAIRDHDALRLDHLDLLSRYNQRFHERNVYLAQLRDTDTLADAVTQGGSLPEDIADDRRTLHETITKLKKRIETLQQEEVLHMHEAQYQISLLQHEVHDALHQNYELREQYHQEHSKLRSTIHDLEHQLQDLKAERLHESEARASYDKYRHSQVLKTNADLVAYTKEQEKSITDLNSTVKDLEDDAQRHLTTIHVQQQAFDAHKRELIDARRDSHDATLSLHALGKLVHSLRLQLHELQAEKQQFRNRGVNLSKEHRIETPSTCCNDVFARDWTHREAESWERQVMTYVVERAQRLVYEKHCDALQQYHARNPLHPHGLKVL